MNGSSTSTIYGHQWFWHSFLYVMSNIVVKYRTVCYNQRRATIVAGCVDLIPEENGGDAYEKSF